MPNAARSAAATWSLGKPIDSSSAMSSAEPADGAELSAEASIESAAAGASAAGVVAAGVACGVGAAVVAGAGVAALASPGGFGCTGNRPRARYGIAATITRRYRAAPRGTPASGV